MIFLESYGRLGNQFFRYAAARALQKEYYPNEKITINFNQIKKLSQNDNSFYNVLEDYNIAEYDMYKNGGKVLFNESNLMQKFILSLYYLGLKRFDSIEMKEELKYQKKWSRILNFVGIYWYRIGYCKLTKSVFKNKILSGSFESPEYFDSIRDDLLIEFTPKHPLLKKNVELFNTINSTDSVCISIRRGDFETNESNKKIHSVCDKLYFEKAIDIIKKKINNPVLIMFSDDIEWVKSNIKTDIETYYEDGTDPVWEKLRLMSACKNFIISNSTFSWWSQWLSKNDNKIVISPNRWFNNDYDSPLIDKENWILIEV